LLFGYMRYNINETFSHTILYVLPHNITNNVLTTLYQCYFWTFVLNNQKMFLPMFIQHIVWTFLQDIAHNVATRLYWCNLGVLLTNIVWMLCAKRFTNIGKYCYLTRWDTTSMQHSLTLLYTYCRRTLHPMFWQRCSNVISECYF
jgi:hypothetical protein